ncbi:MAG: hypothetical protein Q607_CBUC00054G0153, partial [Clostridium butyricum DORA_1]
MLQRILKFHQTITAILYDSLYDYTIFYYLSKSILNFSLSQVKVGNDFIYFLSIILQSISIVALP